MEQVAKVRGSFRAALKDIRQAERLALAALAREYPVAARIRYLHGMIWRYGTVEEHSSWGLRTLVHHDRSGRMVWIYAERLEHDD